MSQIRNLVDKLRKESALKEKQQKASMEQRSEEQYKKISDVLCDMRERNEKSQESIVKKLNELMSNKYIVYKIINDNMEDNAGLPLSPKNKELFLQFVSEASEVINQGMYTTLQSLDHKYYDILGDINLAMDNVKHILNEMEKSIDLIENLHHNVNQINNYDEQLSLSDDHSLEGSIFEH